MGNTWNYTAFKFHLGLGLLDLASDTLKVCLLTSAYTPNQDADATYADIMDAEVTGIGYTAGGQALTSVTWTQVLANTWSAFWVTLTLYSVGQLIRPTAANGFLYRCVVGGTSGVSQPVWPTVIGETVTDGSAIWECYAESVIVLGAANSAWNTSTVTAAYAAIYDATAGNKLICLKDFGGSQTSTGATFQVNWDVAAGVTYLG